MSTEKITILGEELEVPASEITAVIASHDCPKINWKDRLPITSEYGMYHMERVQRLHRMTSKCLSYLFDRDDLEIKIAEVIRSEEGNGVKSICGILDLAFKFIDKGIPIVFIHPECGLHPKVQANLADVFIQLNQYQTFGTVTFIRERKT